MSERITSDRLYTQFPAHPAFRNAADAVSFFGAVQSQDFSGAVWSLGHRTIHATSGSIEAEYNAGRIIRIHVMRPTWHFILPENLRWMQQLTAPRVKMLLGHYNRKLELDDTLFKKSNGIITKSLRNRTHLTRQELKKLLSYEGIHTDVQRLGHIVMWAELDGIICSGPRRGKQFTYALVEDRIAKSIELSREEALARLADLYFRSHGPAQLADFAWWSGLTVKDAQAGLDSVATSLERLTAANKTYWSGKKNSAARSTADAVYLLSIYDEYVIAYTDRSDIGDARDAERMLAMGNALTAVMINRGRITGSWRKIVHGKNIEITLRPFKPMTDAEEKMFAAEAESYGAFFGLPVQTDIV